MSKSEVKAIIDAMTETVAFVMRTGISIRQGIANSAVDEARVNALLNAHEEKIKSIIDSLPDDK